MNGAGDRGSPWRGRALVAVRLGVSVALLAFLFSRVDASALWDSARQASVPWMLVALSLYFVMTLASTWRWGLLLGAQDIHVSHRALLSSYLVAIFFNNFLPSNIGGDVVRIRDTARPARSKTLATTVILIDRVLGMLGLVLVAAIGATVAGRVAGTGPSPIWPSWLWAGFLVSAAATAPAVLLPAGVGRLLRPLTVVHPTWVGDRIEKLTTALGRFRQRPGALARLFRRRGGRAGAARGLSFRHRLRAARAGDVLGPVDHRADLVHRPDDPRVRQRIRRAGGDLCVLLRTSGPARAVGGPGVADGDRPDDGLLAERRGDLRDSRPRKSQV